MTALIAALAAAAVLGGLLLIAAGLRPVPETEIAARPPSERILRLRDELGLRDRSQTDGDKQEAAQNGRGGKRRDEGGHRGARLLVRLPVWLPGGVLLVVVL